MPDRSPRAAVAATAVAAIIGAAWLTAGPPYADVARATINENRSPAGELRDGTLTLELDVVEGRWYAETDDGASEIVQLFAERGGPPLIPGPLIRVPAGTRIVASVRNTLTDSTVTLHGLHTRSGSPDDTVRIAPGETRTVVFDAGEPGTYFYWAHTTPGPLTRLRGIDSQLHGAFIVDPADGAPADDRVFVLGKWHVPPDTAGPEPHVPREMLVINGRSWPHTERIIVDTGDTLRWRWVNPSSDAHPMHLHGFHFEVTSRGTWAADTTYPSDAYRTSVTELMLPGGTMAMEWVPTEPGNWLMHCHFADHVAHFLSFAPVPDAEDPLAADAVDHSVHGMRGLVLGIVVNAREPFARRAERYGEGIRRIRVLVETQPGQFGDSDGLVYRVHEEGPEPAAAVQPMSDAIVLRRDEPVNITVVNRLRAPTGVHWHGMELPSYADGVPGWSGLGRRIAPLIMPGDSFTAAFTPPRAGTFFYHSHSNETYQITSGLFGPLLVLDDAYDPARDLTFTVGGNGMDFLQGRVNGMLEPDTVVLTAGETYRLRLISIFPDWRIWFTLRDGERTAAWLPLAKDGADVRPIHAVRGAARVRLGTGEAADFAFTPETPGALTLDVVTDLEAWSVRVPIRVIAR